MKNTPALSVVMSVYNGERYLRESIESILNQTYRDFEFIIIDDGSNDRSSNIIDQYGKADNRIIVIHHQNIGLTRSLNKGIAIAKGDYIARQDADDVSFLDRLEKQMAFLKNHPGVVLCGTWFEEISEENGKRIRRYPVKDTILRKNLKYTNQFCHPSVIFKKSAFFQAGKYDEKFQTGQDFELWIRLADRGDIVNLTEVLVRRRIGFENAISWKNRDKRLEMIKLLIHKHFHDLKGLNIIKFLYYLGPLIIYPFLPVSLLRVVRIFRYR